MVDTAPGEIAPSPPAPAAGTEPVKVDRLHSLTPAELMALAEKAGIRIQVGRSQHQIIFDLLKGYVSRGVKIVAEGVLELTAESYGFLRSPRFSFKPGPEDAYVSQQLVRRYHLRAGNLISGTLRGPRDREKFMAMDEVLTVERQPAETWQEPKPFDKLTALFPTERIILENAQLSSFTARAIDLITPLGRGQRGLIVAAPRTGKTFVLKAVAKGIRANYPDVRLIVLLVDERPEEVTDFLREVDAEIYSSTFDENPARHVQVADLVSERAKRLVETGHHVVILLDSLTRLARGYNALQPGKGRIMSGGVDAKALLKPKKFFSAARKTEEGGSLTILATALVDTESRMDELIFQEFKGTGNMELHLDRGLLEKRIYPAIHVLNSGTRREDLLYHPAEMERVNLLRTKLAQLPIVEAMEFLLEHLKATKSNAELLMTSLR